MGKISGLVRSFILIATPISVFYALLIASLARLLWLQIYEFSMRLRRKPTENIHILIKDALRKVPKHCQLVYTLPPVDKAPMKEEWALNIKQQTETCGAAFFFKQWGTWGSDGIKRNKHANGKVLGGRVVQQMPE